MYVYGRGKIGKGDKKQHSNSIIVYAMRNSLPACRKSDSLNCAVFFCHIDFKNILDKKKPGNETSGKTEQNAITHRCVLVHLQFVVLNSRGRRDFKPLKKNTNKIYFLYVYPRKIREIAKKNMIYISAVLNLL